MTSPCRSVRDAGGRAAHHRRARPGHRHDRAHHPLLRQPGPPPPPGAPRPDGLLRPGAPRPGSADPRPAGPRATPWRPSSATWPTVPMGATTEELAVQRALLTAWHAGPVGDLSRGELDELAGRPLSEADLEDLALIGAITGNDEGGYEVLPLVDLAVEALDLGTPIDAIVEANSAVRTAHGGARRRAHPDPAGAGAAAGARATRPGRWSDSRAGRAHAGQPARAHPGRDRRWASSAPPTRWREVADPRPAPGAPGQVTRGAPPRGRDQCCSGSLRREGRRCSGATSKSPYSRW